MADAKKQMESLTNNLLGTCSLDEMEFYLMALDRAREGLAKACEQGRLSQEEADMLLTQWLTD
jgi:hypothetical protein